MQRLLVQILFVFFFKNPSYEVSKYAKENERNMNISCLTLAQLVLTLDINMIFGSLAMILILYCA